MVWTGCGKRRGRQEQKVKKKKPSERQFLGMKQCLDLMKKQLFYGWFNDQNTYGSVQGVPRTTYRRKKRTKQKRKQKLWGKKKAKAEPEQPKAAFLPWMWQIVRESALAAITATATFFIDPLKCKKCKTQSVIVTKNNVHFFSAAWHRRHEAGITNSTSAPRTIRGIVFLKKKQKIKHFQAISFFYLGNLWMFLPTSEFASGLLSVGNNGMRPNCNAVGFWIS